MGHSYNNGLHTSSKGITVDSVRVTGLNGADASLATIAEDCKSGLVASVTITAVGTYTFQLSKPYPPKLVVCMPRVSQATNTTDMLTASYKTASYDATLGTFVVNVSDDDDVGAPIAAKGSATDELHVLMMFNRYTR